MTDEVWIDGDSFYKSINHNKQSTIYFSEWSGYVKQFLEDDSYFVAIQLSENFDPLPNDDIKLPTLTALAAIGDKNTRTDYYKFLEDFGRTHGVNHMILPDTSGLDAFKKEVLTELNTNSPYYFLASNALSFDIPDTKKEFIKESKKKPVIWVADQDINTKKISKWRAKSKREKNRFYSAIKRARSTRYHTIYELPASLEKLLFNHAMVAIDPNHQLPIIDETICYLGSDAALREQLSKYKKVIPYRKEGIPVVLDNRQYTQEVDRGDIVLQYSNSPIVSAALILSDMNTERADITIAQALFGARSITGRSSHPFSRQISNPMYLGYSDPSEESLDPYYLQLVDSFAIEAVSKRATPGIQLAVVKNGSMILNKSYGYYTYDSIKKVSNETLYDIASLTKVVSTLPAIALLVDQGKINLDDSLSMHLKEFSKSNKAHVTVRQLLSHNAGILSYVPFWSMVMTGDRLDAFYYKTPQDEALDIRTYGLEPDPIMLDSLKSYIVRSRLIKNPVKYHYSDLGFMILHLLVERISGQTFYSIAITGLAVECL
ncbi:MAG: serine hydrolase domain-containing protein, partial [Bacteroidota bacterium]